MLDDLLTRAAFAVDGRVVTWGDVIAAARASGDWEATEAAAAAGLAAVASADMDAAVAAHVAQWRRARRLISADDTVAFLSRWGVSEREWLAHVRRQVAARRSAATPASGGDSVELDSTDGPGRAAATAGRERRRLRVGSSAADGPWGCSTTRPWVTGTGRACTGAGLGCGGRCCRLRRSRRGRLRCRGRRCGTPGSASVR